VSGKRKLLLKESVSLVWKSSSGWATANVLVILIRSLLPLLMIYFIKNLIDTITSEVSRATGNSFQFILLPVLAVVVAFFLDEIFSDIGGFVQKKQAYLLEEHMNNLLHAKSILIDLQHFERPEYYDCLSRASREAPWRPNNIVNNMLSIFRGSISLFLMAGLIAGLHWALTLLLLAINIPGIGLRIYYSSLLYNFHRDQTPEARKTSYFNWLLTGDRPSREMRLFGLGEYFKSLFAKSFRKQKEEELEIVKKRTLIELLTSLLKAFAVFITILFITRSALKNEITLGDMAMYLLAFRQGMIYIKDIFTSMAGLYEDSLFISDVFEFLKLQEKITAPVHAIKPESLRDAIIVDKLSFSYPGSGKPILKDLSFELRRGETVALVGPNGAGKSTLVRLLCRLYDPDNGQIMWDERNIKEMDPAEYRKMFSVIFQDFMLYNLSAGENIRLGDIKIPDYQGKIKKAAEEAGIHELISCLPKGYETVIGHLFDDSQELSWGEWQKIALARALFRPSPVLILDEPVSALDAETEYEIFNRFRETTHDKTCLLISHRLTNVTIADRILVLNKGIIEESGTHNELMNKEGLYYKMFTMQSTRFNLKNKL
jgi:ATP-binding cassette subfamily B protein